MRFSLSEIAEKAEVMNAKYLAGFFDGEGCIDIQRHHPKHYRRGVVVYVRPRVRIVMSDIAQPIIEEIQNHFGGRITQQEAKQEEPDWSDSVSLEWEGTEDLISVLEEITPYLVIKKEQAKLVVTWMKKFSGLRVDSYPGIDQAREILVDELGAMKKDLNRRSEDAERKIQAALRGGGKAWSRRYDRCVDCGLTKWPHQSHGRCRRCYQKYWRAGRGKK